MIKKLKDKIAGSAEKKRLIANIFSLLVLQGANYILPLLTVPYLVRVLGPEYFGLLAFSTATIAYFTLIADYGFNLSATRMISIYRNHPEKINQIFSSVMTIKISLMVFGLFVLTVLVINISKFNQHWELYFITFGMVLGQVLFPMWLFQGMERMKFISYLNVCSKLFFTVCIFIFVQEKVDYLLVPLFTSLGYIMAGLCSLFLAKREFNIKFSIQSLDVIKEQLYDGWHIFFSNIAISLYTVSITFVLGLMTTSTVVGYYAAADKISQAVRGLYTPISQAMYPFVSRKIYNNKMLGLIFIRKIAIVLSLVMFFVSIFIFFGAEDIVHVLLGDKYSESVFFLKILSMLPFLISVSNIFGIQVMLNFGKKIAFSRILGVAAFLGISLAIFLIHSYGGMGAALTVLIVEVFVTCSMLIYVTFSDIDFLNLKKRD